VIGSPDEAFDAAYGGAAMRNRTAEIVDTAETAAIEVAS
jgi:hypothetical protein